MEIKSKGKIQAALKAFSITAFLFVMDYVLPMFIKRWYYSTNGEYQTPEMLEKRVQKKVFGGYKMFKE